MSSLRTTARKVLQTRFFELSLDLTACENRRNRKVAHFSRASATYASVNATCMWPLSSMLFGPFQCCTFFDSFRSSIFGVKSTKIALVGTIALTMGPYIFRRPQSAKKPPYPSSRPPPPNLNVERFSFRPPPFPSWNSMLLNVSVENRAASRSCRANRPLQATASPRSRPFDVEISSQH